jgi:hypothetical protein
LSGKSWLMILTHPASMCPCDQTMSNGSFQQPQHLWPSKLATPGKNISLYNKNKQFAGPIKITKIYHVAGDFTAPWTGSSRGAAVAMVIVHPRSANAMDDVDAVHVEVRRGLDPLQGTRYPTFLGNVSPQTWGYRGWDRWWRIKPSLAFWPSENCYP